MKEADFLAELKEISLLNEAISLLGWDTQTGMPELASSERGALESYLVGLSFEKEVGTKMADMLTYFDDHQDELSEVGLAAFKKVQENFQKNHAIPKEEMTAFSNAVSTAHGAWQTARKEQDFAPFKDALATNVALTKKMIPYWRKEEATPYDVLLNHYEPGMTVEKLDQVFADLRKGIMEIRQTLAEKGQEPETDFLSRKFPKEQQQRLVVSISQQLGFDYQRGRLDDTIHPFMIGINPNDTRLTTRWNEEDFMMATLGVMHESGHGIYEQNIDKKYQYTPLYAGTSMGIHESQSLFNEIMIGSNRSFWQKQYPFIQESSQGSLGDISFETFYRGIHKTQASFVRIEADSLTYPLHIIIRYEIEKLLFNEELSIEELPKIWNDKYEEYLGIRPENDLEGILQDVHWSGASFGYFPSYALGYMYAAQLLHAMKKEVAVDAVLASDDYQPIRQWLTKHIHQYGASRKPNQLIMDATGEALNPQYLITFMKQLYFDIYQVVE